MYQVVCAYYNPAVPLVELLDTSETTLARLAVDDKYHHEIRCRRLATGVHLELGLHVGKILSL
jgi:hypothetical protein